MISFERRKALERLEELYENGLKNRQKIVSQIKETETVFVFACVALFVIIKLSISNDLDADGHEILALLIIMIAAVLFDRIIKIYLKKVNKRIFLPCRARDYLNQKFVFSDAMMSDEPFVLVLRSFEQSRYLQEKSAFDNQTKFIKETDYEDTNHNVYERIEACLNFPIKVIYCGGTRSCCTINCLQKSLFLIADENWFRVIEILIKKSLFVVLMPGNTKGLLRELNYISQIYLGKCYFFMPKRFDKDPRMLKNWIKTYDVFVKAGVNMPYESLSKNDSFYKMSEEKMNEIEIADVYNFHQMHDWDSIKEVMSELIANNYINSDYLRECLKYYKVVPVINECGIYEVFQD